MGLKCSHKMLTHFLTHFQKPDIGYKNTLCKILGSFSKVVDHFQSFDQFGFYSFLK